VRAVLITAHGEVPSVVEVEAPVCEVGGVVLKVEATGLCRSDWHAWVGHEQVELPHIPGHEIAGTIAEIGEGVTGWQIGDRVTVPFVCACGSCPECNAGNHQVCRNQQQPGFTYWGSFAEYVAVPHAQVNLVKLPDELGFVDAAALGCRFATSYRAVRQVGQVEAGETVAVFGCGGVGLSAVMIAAASGAEVVAIDVNDEALALAREHGAHTTLRMKPGLEHDIRSATNGGADVSIDAIGSAEVVQVALRSLRPLGRHVQIGLLPGPITLELSPLHANELQMLGSHGMAAHHYPQMLGEIASGALRPGDLVTRTISLEQTPAALAGLSEASPLGVTVITPAPR
jgi:alcohol dehydrogenase